MGPGYEEVIWVPVDMAAKVMLELSPLSPKRLEENVMECFNLVNPHSCPWSDLVSVVQEYYAGQGTRLVGVEMDEWLGDLKALDATKDAEKAENYPALKLLDFFEGVKADGAQADGGQGGFGFAIERGVERSPAMAGLQPVGESLMRKWLGEWGF